MSQFSSGDHASAMVKERRRTELRSILHIPMRNGVHKGLDFQGSGVPVIKMGEVYNAKSVGDAVRDRIELSNQELQKLSVATDDLLFCRTSLVADGVGHCSIVRPLSEPTVFASNLIRARVDPERAEPQYWFYYFSSPIGKGQLRSLARGTSVTTITGPDISSLVVEVPPLLEQRAIAHILGTLDDKIELNRRMNQTLEEIARAIFKSWFIDFDPVRAKAAGRQPEGMDAETAALFPDAFVDSELGKIPAGWSVETIANMAEVVGGSTPSTKESSFWENGCHSWATPKDLSKLTVPVLLATERRITEAGLQQISSGLLPVGTVLLSSRAPIGYLAIAEVPVAINQGFIAMKPKSEVSNVFLWLWAVFADDQIKSRANGSTFLEVSKAQFRPIQLAVPPAQVMQAFDDFARPMYQRIVSNERERVTLASMRDLLLPKLLSGEIRVPEAERLMELHV